MAEFGQSLGKLADVERTPSDWAGPVFPRHEHVGFALVALRLVEMRQERWSRRASLFRRHCPWHAMHAALETVLKRLIRLFLEPLHIRWEQKALGNGQITSIARSLHEI